MSDRIIAQVKAVRSKLPGAAALVGVSGCQGSGKTFNSLAAVQQLQAEGLRAIAISLDDYYLTYSAQQSLAAQGNPLLAKRGLPGTHDVGALIQTLKALKQGQSAEVFQYDKSQHEGAGDRAAPLHTEPVDAIILEGWMLGFTSLGPKLEVGLETSPHAQQYLLADIRAVDDNLKQYSEIWDLLDSLILMQATSLENIYTWRLQQEHEMIKRTQRGMSDEQVTAFVDGYMPAYELYLGGVKCNERIVLDLQRKRVHQVSGAEAIDERIEL